jgi:ATP-dependent DNA helicase RecG
MPPRASSPAAKPATRTPLEEGLRKLGLLRDIDLALHLPLRYEDETRITRLRDAHGGDTIQVEGVVTDSEVAFRPRRQLLVTLDDGSDVLKLRFFSFYPSHQKALAPGRRVRVRGEVRGGFFGFEMVHPAFRGIEPGAPLPTALTPVYPTTAGLAQATLRRAVLGGLGRADLREVVPDALLPPGLASLREALALLHQPGPEVSLSTLEDRSHPAWLRLKFEELLAQQLSQLQARAERAQLKALPLVARTGGLHDKLLAALPFALTAAQRRVGDEIARDLARGVPMHRLLQGDVGSGKTVVAALAACVAIDAGFQCVLMAPTEILAEQHFRKLIGWLEPLGITTAWLTGSQKKKERDAMLEAVASGAAGLVVGTHAVIQERVQFARLGLAIVDEQHRFGVAQRLALRSKAHHDDPAIEPHALAMTATPIPRTLAMSYYADLDVSTLDELPPGRTPVVTKVFTSRRRAEVIERIREELAAGRQAYWVCPLIEESETPEFNELSNATATHAELTDALNAPGTPRPVMVGLLHSRMPVAEKRAVMSLFAGGDMGLLVSTTVIEVGVDVPNASLMVIEHAERFGLSQLHQLRGRVGRGAAASVCVLLYGDELSQAGRERLKAMRETNDGFEIARRDLDIRGPGEFMGARQSGAPLLRFADLALDTDLLNWARRAAPTLLRDHPAAAEALMARWLGGRAEYLKA